ncbi:MAG: hypothetical protein FD176_1706 [Rhodospirillaceae bacterium]|nr:MAG: hypothetical protein FD176_1706 [Rhodospirillaceae bacterium]
MKTYWLAALAAFGTLAAGGAAAGEDKWGAHLDLEGKAGTKRNLGEADLFLPVAQDDRTLLFADLRTRLDDEGSREGNFGLGIRRMLESGWNLGGYGFLDRRRSTYSNYFNQMTVGAEALSLDWDFRVNGYVPVGRTSYQEDSLSTAEISGAGVIFRGGEERSLGGFDAEIGWRIPIFADDADRQVRVYAGGYRFADEGIPMVAGPRGRAEMVFDEVPGLWEGSRLALGAELQNDDPRGTQGFLSARLRIPLQAGAKPSRLTPMERRMADPIVRDIDVVAQAGAFGAAETATTTGGNAISVVSSHHHRRRPARRHHRCGSQLDGDPVGQLQPHRHHHLADGPNGDGRRLAHRAQPFGSHRNPDPVIGHRFHHHCSCRCRHHHPGLHDGHRQHAHRPDHQLQP